MIVKILRRKNQEDTSFWQTFSYTTEDDKETVLMMLKKINQREELVDVDGNPADKISFKQSCLQKKCGACSMVINGKPRLACGTKLSDLGEEITLEPLKKFPVIEDLIVDRSIMMENLKMMEVYLTDEPTINEKRNELSYEASRCLQCGCCLEVCPNFMANNGFTGMAGAMPISRIINELNKGQLSKPSKVYDTYVYSGCGKSLSCVDICPAKIRIEDMLVNSNAIAIWKRYQKE